VEEGPGGLPLAVDMDGTLILTDMSWVSFNRVIIRRPWMLPSILLKELTGRRAEWKRDLAERLVFNPAEIEYHSEFLDWLTGEHTKGRLIILATASDRLVAEQIAGHVGLFSDVLASDMSFNLRGKKKAEALVARFGEGGFSYAGNSRHDLDVWSHAGEVIVVNPERGLLNRIGDNVDIVFE
jgi:phosphoserine phosphatase